MNPNIPDNEQALNNFNDIEDNYVRAYNRLIVMFNLNEEGLVNQALEYAKQFSNTERLEIAVLTADIKENGWKAVKLKIQDRVGEEVTLH